MSQYPLIGIVMATMLEAEPLIESLKLSKIEDKPFMLFQSTEHILVISGIGKANAAMATT